MAKPRLALLALATFLLPCGFADAKRSEPHGSGHRSWSAGHDTISTRQLVIGSATIDVQIDSDHLKVDAGEITCWIQNAARAVTVFYGRFPVQHALVRVVPGSDADNSIHGTTWGNLHGFQAITRMRLGQQVTERDLAEDWTMTHELVHTALASLPDDQHWMEEGTATYIEPIARAQAGELSANQVWLGMVRGMSHGEPESGDRGLDRTHSWARTYWGGALFCFVADVMIRRQTHNRKGLQDALRAIVAEGATIDHERFLINVLQTGDRATGTTVLVDLYKAWKDKPVTVDLKELWLELGIYPNGDSIDFDSNATLSSVRESVTATLATM
jgi:hypothetical protein